MPATGFPPLPDHLAGTRATGFRPGRKVVQYEIGSMQNFNYLVLDWSRREAAWVDPQKDVSGPLKDLEEAGFRLTTVLLTHTHHDHIPGTPALAERCPDLTIRVHQHDAHRLKSWTEAIRQRIAPVSEGDRIDVGSIPVQVLHTPGHSAGECSYFIEAAEGEPPYLFTGDTLFIRDCGRTDLPTGDTAQMFESLNRLRMLPPETVILPGHHYAPEVASTLARELVESPPFQCRSAEELARLP